MVEGGVDIIEVGVPYSDPVMDGPTIQAAAEPAVRAGVGIAMRSAAVRAVADAGGAAVIMSYWNPIERYGVERFAADLAAAGGSGAITPDLIPDEAAPWLAATDAPGSTGSSWSRRRRPMPASRRPSAQCRGFVYAASTMGVTGVRGAVSGAAQTAGRAGPGGRRRAARCASASACRTPIRRPRSPPSPMGSSSVRRSSAGCSTRPNAAVSPRCGAGGRTRRRRPPPLTPVSRRWVRAGCSRDEQQLAGTRPSLERGVGVGGIAPAGTGRRSRSAACRRRSRQDRRRPRQSNSSRVRR